MELEDNGVDDLPSRRLLNAYPRVSVGKFKELNARSNVDSDDTIPYED